MLTEDFIWGKSIRKKIGQSLQSKAAYGIWIIYFSKTENYVHIINRHSFKQKQFI